MNRRSLFKSVVAGLAAVCGYIYPHTANGNLDNGQLNEYRPSRPSQYLKLKRQFDELLEWMWRVRKAARCQPGQSLEARVRFLRRTVDETQEAAGCSPDDDLVEYVAMLRHSFEAQQRIVARFMEFDSLEPPGKIAIHAAPAKVQCDGTLKPCAVDASGRIVPIESVTCPYLG